MSKRMPIELNRMHGFLTQDDPDKCRNYHYNFERQAPRLYHDQQQDSLLEVIEYIKTECGPAANLEVTRLLLLICKGRFGDSLVGSATIPQMLWYRSEQEGLLGWREWAYLYGLSQPIDNTHDNFAQFRSALARLASENSVGEPQGQILGQFYGGAFDSAFSRIQSDELWGSSLRRNYDEFVSRVKRLNPARANVGILIGSWIPQGNNSLLGNHPEIGLQLGGEAKLWRADAIISYRFSPAKREFLVDSLGQLTPTRKFSSWLFGIEGGLKLLDTPVSSTELFGGLGYDVIYSITEAGDPENRVGHGSLAASIGFRQRLFLNQRSGWYVGGVIRYSVVGYGNPGGTDLSGNTLTISFVNGWSFNETLKQFLRKLNYKGNWRQ
jgi:hypothetical protein